MHSPRLFAIEPQRSGGIFDSEAELRDRCGVGSDWLETGINSKTRSGQPGAWLGEA